MKKFTKLFLSCAAVAAITGAIATSALADGTTVDLSSKDNIKGTYDSSTGVVTFTELPTAYTDTTKTLLILKPASVATESVSPSATTGITVEAANVIAIDQGETLSSAKISTNGIDLENNTYTVLLGGTNGNVYTATFGKATSSVLLGDADLSGEIDLDDATAIVYYTLELGDLEGDALIAADVDDQAGVDLDDATAIVYYTLELPGSYHVGETK